MIAAATSMIVACGGKSGDAPTTVSPSTKTAPSSSADLDTADRMVGHFIEIAAMERSLVNGDLADLRARAQLLVEQSTEDPDDWGEYLQRFRRAAAQMTTTYDVAAAAAALASTASECGACHRAQGMRLEPPPLPNPAEPTTVAERMGRHQWATDLLRSAIVFSHADMWAEGTRIMAEAPLDMRELSGEGPIDAAIAAKIARVRTLGNGAATATVSEWEQIYGDLLETCASCHAFAR